MIIGDDWLTKTMLINTLSKNPKLQSQLNSPTSQFGNLFTKVLGEILNNNESELTTRVNENSFLPHLELMSPIFTKANTEASFKKENITSDDSLQFQSISAEKINETLGGKLKGFGEMFVKAGQQFNINPGLLAAIAKHETGNGTSRASIVKNNIAGMMGKSGLKTYASVEDSIMDMARNLSSNYLGKGLSSISSIGSKYAPIGAENDPTGLNNHWVKGVSKYFNQITV
ncbi:glucosaminidase domain-containing protein [Neobacillus citreus]|uniref:Glucosaminidase domain-containing protein n=2 Tax=Neobacillus citreus TaxID=2833578 RepID=A0A9J6MYX3_9BACI|nr:glucosaminidase domain-containing protein [Neobacillus citreus]MCH6266827.1 glucosaminidase domain-containing protein [Neobacillus citreus]